MTTQPPHKNTNILSLTRVKLTGKANIFIALLGIPLAAVIMALDYLTALGHASGVAYVTVVLVGYVARSPLAVWLFAGLGTILTIGGYFLSPDPGVPYEKVIVNRALAIFAIGSTALVCYLHLRSVSTLKFLANRDQLTGTYNRHALIAKASEHIKLWQRYQTPLSLILVDVDHFKKINDTHGHLAGDRVLQHLARLLQQHTRNADMVCRYGGEEFAILLPMVELDGALATAQRIQHALSESWITWESATLSPTVSMGVAELVEPQGNFEGLIAEADKALYKAKALGRNRIIPMPKSIKARKTA